VIGGSDRLIVAVARRGGSDPGSRVAVHELRVGSSRWRRRPDAPGVLAVVRGGLVAVSLRCTHPVDESDASCDVMAASLRDGSSRWRTSVASRRPEPVHEGAAVDLVANTPTTAIVTTFRADRLEFQIGLRSARALPAVPNPAADPVTDPIAHYRVPLATCTTGSDLVRVAIDGRPTGAQPGVAWLSSLRLRSDPPTWSRLRRLVAPSGPAALASFACSARGALAFDRGRTLVWRDHGWSRIATGTPSGLFGKLSIVDTATDLVLPTLGPDSGISQWWWLHGRRWTRLPPSITPSSGGPGLVVAAFGRRVVARVDDPADADGPTFRFLRPSPGPEG
jgi:hypothetical protein